VKLEIQIGGRKRAVSIERRGARLVCRLDGRELAADAVEVAPGVYSILLAGQSFEVRVEPRYGRLAVHVAGRELLAEVVDPRRWRRAGAAVELAGSQQVAAPMPGKVVRLLVKRGDAVEANQALLVIEAMKMQNEIRAPKAGVVERLLVAEGQAVIAGEVVAVVA
jgi:biotin carboxyl carrier protein